MSRPLALPEPENARDLELERLRVERDAAVAEAERLRAELHRTWCALSLEIRHIEHAKVDPATWPCNRVIREVGMPEGGPE